MRLVVARCEVTYSGRLSAFLPESTRLLMLKADGSVLVHADAGGYKPLNWMTPPTVVEEGPGRLVVRKRAGRSEDRLEIRIAEVLSDVEHDMGEAAGLEKDGVEPEGTEHVRVGGRDARLIVWSPDYDGKGKAWVRFADGEDAIVGGSKVERL